MGITGSFRPKRSGRRLAESGIKRRMIKKIKSVIKKFVDYTIEDDMRVYRLRHTPVRLKKPLTKAFLQKYGSLAVEPYKIVCDNYMGSGYGCNGKYVTEILLKSETPYDIVWAVKEKEKHAADFPERVRIVEYGTEEAMYEYATAAVWLCNYHLIYYFNRGLVKKPGQSYIQMWHGSFGIKKIENDCGILNSVKSWTALAKKNAAETDYWISNSGFETGVYRSAFWGAGNILEYGHPRNDIFFDGDRPDIRASVNGALGISDSAKLCLYVPTFREKGEPQTGKIDVANVLAGFKARGEGDWSFAVRFHPRMKDSERSFFLERWDGIVNATDYPDIQELLFRADAVITDYSSCVFDFLLGKKMAFLFVPDRAAYLDERGFYYPLEESPFPIAESNGELFLQIKNFDRKRYGKRRDAFLAQKQSKEDGRAALRVAALIERILLERRSRTKEEAAQNHA